MFAKTTLAIFLHINNIVDQKRGPSFWKFNASLAEDGNFVTLINESIPTWLEEFKTIDDKRLLWNLIKYKIRQLSIKYGKEKARKKRKRITDIEASLTIWRKIAADVLLLKILNNSKF